MNYFSSSVNFNILHQAIRLDDPAAAMQETVHLIEQHSIDWDDLFVYATYHCVKPQLAALLNKMPSHLVPTDIREKLKLANLSNAYRQLRNVSEFFQIKSLLEERGIQAVPFKGFWLAEHFYGNLANRESVDIDLFIDINNLKKIKTIMGTRGYVPEEPLEQLTNEFIVNELCEYNFDLYQDNTRVFHIEFHWRISLAVFGMDIRLKELQPQITTSSIQHKELPVFTDVANLLLVIMHHGGKDQFFQLKQVMDIACILQKEPVTDWDWIILEAKRFDMVSLVYIAVRLASLLCGVPIPEAIKEEVNSKRIQRLTDGRIKMMSEPPNNWNSWGYNFRRWQFLVQTRESKKLKNRLIKNILQKDVLPRFVPKKLHHFFLNKKIRITSL